MVTTTKKNVELCTPVHMLLECMASNLLDLSFGSATHTRGNLVLVLVLCLTLLICQMSYLTHLLWHLIEAADMLPAIILCY